MARKNKMSYQKYLDRYPQRDKEPKKYYTYMDRYNSNGRKKENAMAYKNKNKKKNGMKYGKNDPMIAKDYNSPANLPQNVKHTMYDKPYYMDGEMYNVPDSVASMDEQIRSGAKKMYKSKGGQKYPEKY